MRSGSAVEAMAAARRHTRSPEFLRRVWTEGHMVQMKAYGIPDGIMDRDAFIKRVKPVLTKTIRINGE